MHTQSPVTYAPFPDGSGGMVTIDMRSTVATVPTQQSTREGAICDLAASMRRLAWSRPLNAKEREAARILEAAERDLIASNGEGAAMSDAELMEALQF